ncbi:hypothetical protein B0H11DRAFT_786299 [Mycena galericulata]|nr:hypothetical protein B0H11DRAFT_786299 [Mycena galericulata]
MFLIASGKFTFSSTQGSGGGARGPVGLGGPGGFTSRPDIERAGSDDGSFTRGNGNATNGTGNPFVRTSVRKERAPQPHPQPQRTALNPASHQTQVMAPTLNDTTAAAENPTSGAGAGVGGVEMGAGGVGAIGINPASHQAQLMAGMPVPHLFSNPTPSPNSTAQPNQDAQYRDAPPAAAVPPPTPGRQTFAVGDDEGEGDDEEGAGGEVQVAELRGRMGGEGEGVIRL